MKQIGTLKQYADAMRDHACEDYGISKAEYERSYPIESRESLWIRAIESAVRAGETISRHVLDDLCRRDEYAYSRLVHDYPGNASIRVPVYMPPSVRAVNREHEAGMREARRRGRDAFTD